MKISAVTSTSITNSDYHKDNDVIIAPKTNENQPVSELYTKQSSLQNNHEDFQPSHRTPQLSEYNKRSINFSEEALKQLEQTSKKAHEKFIPGAFVDLWF
jgi:hypothetical protein